ncbi:MAG: TATA-box-binding protein [Methanosarcinales archaeon Met12]|nr:MAG: TATA-box-binding protein [Methanosarcinales archaeon Met12]
MLESPVKIENVVASMHLADGFDLKQIGTKLNNAEYDKKKFPGLVYRVKNPKAAFLIFKSGKVNCTGARRVEDVKKATEGLTAELRNIGLTIRGDPEIVVQNIVASADLGTELNLNAIAIGLGLENIEYEPEVFPGLVYRVSDPKLVVLIFGSGKLVITGCKTPEDCEMGVEVVRRQLEALNLL